MKKIRTFVAIALPDDVKDMLERVQYNYRDFDAFRWTGRDNLHLTLRFLGDTPANETYRVCEMIDSAVQGLSPFTFDVRSIGWFPTNKEPRVLWAGVEPEDDTLFELQARLEEGAVVLGFPEERRAYKPHVTLARSKGRVDTERFKRVAVRQESWEFGKVLASELVYLQSELRPGGAVYTPLYTKTLGG